ncbi:atp synthase subunit 6 [Phaffia rhodozyma]|uniref:ATP synthase subunit a n=1 Tax=Phaffia rhodozyma TaxID=264483 RepID=A0A0F7SEE8_PHARH|nr:atp synthase subunit 6 [Phaffia rhodozyma]
MVGVALGVSIVLLGVYALPSLTEAQLIRWSVASLGVAPFVATPLEQFKSTPLLLLDANSFMLPLTVSGLVAQESIGATLLSLVRAQLGNKHEVMFPLMTALFLVVLVLNVLGNVPYGFTVTSSLSVTLGLSLSIWFYTLLLGIAKDGLGFLSHFVPDGTPLVLAPLLVVIETVSYCARAVSLGVRLFSNMLAGHTLLAILSGFLSKLVVSSAAVGIACIIPFGFFVALVGLELAVSFIQAFVLVVLTASYIPR